MGQREFKGEAEGELVEELEVVAGTMLKLHTLGIELGKTRMEGRAPAESAFHFLRDGVIYRVIIREATQDEIDRG